MLTFQFNFMSVFENTNGSKAQVKATNTIMKIMHC